MALLTSAKHVNSLSFDSDSSKDTSPRSVLAGHFSARGSDNSITPVVSGEHQNHAESAVAGAAEKRQYRRAPFGIGRHKLAHSETADGPAQNSGHFPRDLSIKEESGELAKVGKEEPSQEKGSWKGLFSWKKSSGSFSDSQEVVTRTQKSATANFSQPSNHSSQNLSTASSEISSQKTKISLSNSDCLGQKCGSNIQERKFRRSLTFFDGRSSLGTKSDTIEVLPKPQRASHDLVVKTRAISGDKSKIPLPSSKTPSGKKFSRWNSFNDTAVEPKKRTSSTSSRGRSKKKEEAEAVKMAETLTLSLMRGSLSSKILAVKEIRVITKFSAPAREALGLSGAIGLLINLLNEVDWVQMEIVIFALCNLGIGNRRNKILIVEGGFLARMNPILKVAPSSVREACIAVVLSLAAEDEHKASIGKAGIIPYITRTLNSGSDSGRCDSAHALYNLLGFEANRGEILSTQPIPGLLKLMLDSPDNKAAEKAAAIIYTFTAVEKGRATLVETPTAVPALLAMIEGGSERGRELAVSSLFTVCTQSRRFCAAATKVEAGKMLSIHAEDMSPKMQQKVAKLVKCLDMVAASSSTSSSSSSASSAGGSAISRKASIVPMAPPSPLIHHKGLGEGRNSALKDLVEESMRGALSKIKSRVHMS